MKQRRKIRTGKLTEGKIKQVCKLPEHSIITATDVARIIATTAETAHEILDQIASSGRSTIPFDITNEHMAKYIGLHNAIGELKMPEDELEHLLSTWESKNIREYSRHSPTSEQTILRLYMNCVGEEVKAFTATNFVTKVMQRQTRWISFGTTCVHCGRKTRIALTWESPHIVEAENRAMGSEKYEAIGEIM